MRVLFVAALPEESAALTGATDVLHLGVGKVQAAATLGRHLADHGREIDLVVNLGTAGGLHGQPLAEVREVGTVHQHDFDQAGLSSFVGRDLPGGALRLAGPPEARARLATGDRLVLDPRERGRLAGEADLVDMEGYAVASVGAAFGIPVRIVKAVSDSADEQAATTWRDALARCADALAGWAVEQDLVG